MPDVIVLSNFVFSKETHMPGPDILLGSIVPYSLPSPTCFFAYVGLGPGQEFIPYFLALLGFMGTAVVAVAQWPLLLLRRCLAGSKDAAATWRQHIEQSEPEISDGGRRTKV
jgi:hypothetical protein